MAFRNDPGFYRETRKLVRNPALKPIDKPSSSLEEEYRPIPKPPRTVTITGLDVDAVVFALGITAKKQPKAFGIDLRDLQRKIKGE